MKNLNAFIKINRKNNISVTKIITFLIIILLEVSVTPALALEYNPGVTVGQWIKYGNIKVNSTDVENLVNVEWIKQEVVTVAGKEVSLRTTMKLNNGTILDAGTSIYNVEIDTVNGIKTTAGTITIIAANLNKGDPLSTTPPLKINKTEIRTYLGVNRSVNIINLTISMGSFGNQTVFEIFDKVSGMLLEIRLLTISTYPPTSIKISFSVIDTNIFAVQTTIPTATNTSSTVTNITTSTTSTLPTSTSQTSTSTSSTGQDIPIEWIVPIVVIVIAVVLILLIRRRK